MKQEWWVYIVAGVVAVALALWVLFAPGQAADVVGAAAAIYLLAAGGIRVIAELTTSRRNRSALLLLTGVVGAIVGALVLFLAFTDFASVDARWTILAAGLVAYGGLGVFINVFVLKGEFQWGPVLINGLLFLWGALVLLMQSREAQLTTWTGWILLAAGAVALGWGLYLRTRPTQPA